MLFRRLRPLPAALACGLSLGVPSLSLAQITPGAASGSGPRTPPGSTSTFRGNIPGGSSYRLTPEGPLPRADLPGQLESLRDPEYGQPLTGLQMNPDTIKRMNRDLEGFARGITGPSQRDEVLERAARIQIQGVRDVRLASDLPKLDAARLDLIDAWRTLPLISDQLMHDNRSVALVDTLILLGEVYQDQALLVESTVGLDEPTPTTPRASGERQSILERSFEAFALASRVAGQIRNPNYRTETVYRVADAQARSAFEIANAQLDGGAAASPGAVQETFPRDRMADRAFYLGAEHARTIQRPVWRDRAILVVSNQAAEANRFGPALDIARMIPNPEIRADALIRVAESHARRRGGARAATETYTEAARSVAAIKHDDPRAILADVLINSLILSGRFDDARASIGLFRDPVRRYEALGVIAENMGRRGLDREAKAWILGDTPPDQQSSLLRRVGLGMVASIDQDRTNAQNRMGYGSTEPTDRTPPPPPPSPDRATTPR